MGHSSSLAVLTLVAEACSRASATGGDLQMEQATSVAVARVTTRTVQVEVHAPVETRPLQAIDLGPERPGVVENLYKDKGDSFKQGDVLARVRLDEKPSLAEAARHKMLGCQKSANYKSGSCKDKQELFKRGLISRDEMDKACAEAEEAQNQYATAQDEYHAAQSRQMDADIVAPFDGVVRQVHRRPGEPCGTGSPVISLMQVKTIRAIVPVPESQARDLQVGQRAYVVMEGRTYHGSVGLLSPEIDQQSRTRDAEIYLNNVPRHIPPLRWGRTCSLDGLYLHTPDGNLPPLRSGGTCLPDGYQLPDVPGDLLPGMYGEGHIILEEHPEALTVPARALHFGRASQKPTLFVVGRDNVVRVKEVLLGVDADAWIEVLQGVGPDDRVVVGRTEDLEDCQVIRPSEAG